MPRDSEKAKKTLFFQCKKTKKSNKVGRKKQKKLIGQLRRAGQAGQLRGAGQRGAGSLEIRPAGDARGGRKSKKDKKTLFLSKQKSKKIKQGTQKKAKKNHEPASSCQGDQHCLASWSLAWRAYAAQLNYSIVFLPFSASLG